MRHEDDTSGFAFAPPAAVVPIASLRNGLYHLTGPVRTGRGARLHLSCRCIFGEGMTEADRNPALAGRLTPQVR